MSELAEAEGLPADAKRATIELRRKTARFLQGALTLGLPGKRPEELEAMRES